ncbi:MAG: hypothetical protein RL238_2951, partial [Actinomycetota bacterium]
MVAGSVRVAVCAWWVVPCWLTL